MIYIRGNRRDFDYWNYLANEGWSYDEVLPYFKKSEDYEGGASEYHGVGGPLSIVEHATPSPVAQAFVQAAVELGYSGPGWDFNGETQENGAGFYQATKTKDRKRCSTATAFIHPILERPNFTVKTKAQVTRLLIDNGCAIGVEYIQDGTTHQVKADREVIVSCGVFDSPKLLMLSGIGPAEHLKSHGIPVVLDLPGVGQNLQDHLLLGVGYKCKQEQPAPTLLSECGLFTRTRSGISAASPELQFFFGPVQFIAPQYQVDGPGFTFAPIVTRPQSVGSVSLRSNNPLDLAVVRANYLESEADVKVFIKAIQLSRELAHTHAFNEFRDLELAPGIHVKSDSELTEYIRNNCGTVWHPVGTCKMGRDKNAVVDPQLRVHGIEGLRVADASIMPTIVAGNTNAACIMIGEKAADMILAAIG